MKDSSLRTLYRYTAGCFGSAVWEVSRKLFHFPQRESPVKCEFIVYLGEYKREGFPETLHLEGSYFVAQVKVET